MNKSMKLMALIATLAVSGTMFASCGGTDGSSTTSSGSSGSTSAGSSASGSASSAGNKLIWWQIGTQPENVADGINKANEYSKEKIGVEIDMKFADWGVWNDKIKTIVNAGEAFDIMFTNGDMYNSHVGMGAFADLTEKLPTVTPDLYKFIPENVWPGVKVNGKIYSIPTYKDSSQTQYWVWDEEIVNNLKIDYKNITTYAQLDPVLYQIKDAIAAGTVTGTSYAFPNFRDGVNGQFMFYDRPAFEIIGVRYDDKDMKIVNVLEQPDIMENLKYMHKWYKDGIINPDANTLSEGPKWLPLNSAQGFPGADTNWTTNRGKQTVSQPWGGPIYSTTTITGSVNAISKNSKYIDDALKYLQLANLDPKLRNILAFGVEDVNFKDNGDGTVTKLDDRWTAAAYSQATFFTMSPVAPNAPDQWTLVQKQNETATASVLLGFSFDRTPVEAEYAACSAVWERYKFDIFTGAVDPEKQIPVLYKELESVGLSKIRDEMQKQLDAWKATL